MTIAQIVRRLLLIPLFIGVIHAGYSYDITLSEAYYLHRSLFDKVCQLHKRIIKESDEGKNPEKVYTNKDFGREYTRLSMQYYRDRPDIQKFVEPEDIDLLDQALLNLNNDLYGVTPIKPWLIAAWENYGEK